jgi:hypothetical protein
VSEFYILYLKASLWRHLYSGGRLGLGGIFEVNDVRIAAQE